MPGHCPLPFHEEGNENGDAFYNRIIGIFMVYQVGIETNLLQLCADPDNSEWFSIISGIIF